MDDLHQFLKTLISAPGLSGYEPPVRRLIEDAWRPLTTRLEVSRMGSLHGLVQGRGPEPRPSILLSAHMDAIGLMATGVEGSFVRITAVGGIDPRILPGQLVTVHATRQTPQDLPGLVAGPPGILMPAHLREHATPLDQLWVDLGLSPEDTAALVQVGDVISFAQPPLELEGDLIAGHSLDNRASVVAVTACLQALQVRPPQLDVWAVASTQEEVGLVGAGTSAYQLQPALSVAVDVTYGSGPGSPEHLTFPLGGGLTLGWGPSVHPALYRIFQTAAERLEIPYHIEPMSRTSGTDGDAMQLSGAGLINFVLSIPLRYMHMPVEIVSFKDIQRAGRLLAEVAASLTADDLKTLQWDD